MSINRYDFWDVNSVVSEESSRTELVEYTSLEQLNQKVGSLQQKQKALEEEVNSLRQQALTSSIELNNLARNQSKIQSWAKKMFGMAGNRIEKLEEEVNSPMHLSPSYSKKK